MKLKKFETKRHTVTGENAIFIDGELFDWSVDQDAFFQVMSSKDTFLIDAMKQDIEKHFLESLSEFVGRKLTNKEVKKARTTGWI